VGGFWLKTEVITWGIRHHLPPLHRAMDIEILFFDDCPNWRSTEALVDQVLSDSGLTADIRHTLVESDEAAQRLSFRGSPTVLINGVDPWADPSAPVGLSCRIYRTDSGFAGSPSEAQLTKAIVDAG